MANNYGSLEGTMDANGILGGEIQFNGAGGKVKDVQVNDVSVVDANGIAKIDLTDYAKTEDIPADLADLQDDADHRTVTDAEKTEWSGKADTSDIPTDLADLNDDATHRLVTDTEKSTWDNKADVSDIPTVNNPTITIQKNGQNVDTFTLNQTANKVIDISVPTKTSDIQNDSSFITNTVNNLANYYLKSDTYTQTEVNNLISAAVNGRFEKVTTLPASGEPNVIYLVPKTTALTNNVYDEYIWQDNAWELLGSTEIDLSNYVTTTDLSTALADYVTSSTFNTTIANYYTKTEVGNLLDGKVDKVSGKGLSTNDYDNTAKGIVDTVTSNLANKVDKVTGATENNFAALDANGNLKDSGHKHSDYLTQHQDISGKADKVSSATNGNLAGLNGQGNLTDSGWNGAKDTTSISGNPISISGLKATQLAVNPIITFEPIQAGSGTPSPSNIRAISGYDKIEVLSVSKNIWGENWEVGSINNTTGQNESDATNIRQKDYTVVKPNQAYFLRCATKTLRLYWYDVNHDFISTDTASTVGTSRTSPANAKYLRVRTTDSYGSTYGNNITVAEGSHSVDYQPSVKTTSISESLGQTVYGGMWTVRTGNLTNLFKKVTYTWGDGTSATSVGTNTRKNFTLPADAVVASPAIRNKAISDKAPMVANHTEDSIHFYIGSSAIYIFMPSNTDTSMTIDICYVATGEIQLTPHEISLLKNYAYVSTNGTTIALDYHNGEMASLGDVVQLSETVERLTEYIKGLINNA